MKYLVVGLGNPGKEYENTRHNIGFKVLDCLAKQFNTFFVSDKLGEVAEIKHKGRTLVLLKPSTFMNLSGKAVNYWMQKEKIHIQSLLIVTDDLALSFGTLRLRGKGSDGGHNGLKSVAYTLNSTEYARLKFGIGNDFNKGQQVNYVLNEWSAEETVTLNDRIEVACEIITSFVSIGLNRTMSAFNNK